MTRWGYLWGNIGAATMQRMFQWDNLSEWLKAAFRLTRIMGAGTPTLVSQELDAETGCFSTEVSFHDSVEADNSLAEFGTLDRPRCWILMGYFSGQRYLLPWQERVLRGTGVPWEG